MIRDTWRGTLAVIQFEGRRSMHPGRWALWIVLAAFPIAITSIVRVLAERTSPQMADTARMQAEELAAWALLIFVLTQLTSVLGVLLWASPAIQLELENRTWIFTASRPYGRRCLLLGRYVVAVLWSFAASGVAVVACCLIAQPSRLAATMATLLTLAALSCIGFAALYCLMAVLFPKRAMAVAFGFTILFELLIGFVPAMINQFTIQFRLRCLLFRWLGLEERLFEVRMLFSDASTFHHLLMLAIYTSVLLTAAVLLLEQRELVEADD